jgi:peptidoglycan/xylan/chitin deacetylase (PgdA/CDA1 family)
VGAHVSSGRPFDDPVAAITFDDGYRDVYENAFPYLKRKGIPAAVFVVTDLIDQPLWQTHDRLYYLVEKTFNTSADARGVLFELMTELDLPTAQIFRRGSVTSSMSAVSALLPVLRHADVVRLMNRLEARIGSPFAAGAGPVRRPDAETILTWPMIHEMRRAGVTIGSHTRTHVCLPAEKPDDIREELEGSKRILEAELGETIDHFAYPGGQFTPSIVRALHDAGYRYGYTACPHGDATYPALTLERLLLWEGSSIGAAGEFSPAVFNCQIHDLWPPARRCERTHHV